MLFPLALAVVRLTACVGAKLLVGARGRKPLVTVDATAEPRPLGDIADAGHQQVTAQRLGHDSEMPTVESRREFAMRRRHLQRRLQRAGVGMLQRDLYVELYAPGDYIDAVNTKALPRYMKRQRLDFGKGEAIEASMNVMPLVTCPRVLFTAKATEWIPIANGGNGGTGNGGSAGGNGGSNGGDVEGASLAATRTRRAA